MERAGLLAAAKYPGVGRAYFITRTGGQQRPPFLDPKANDKHMSKKQEGCAVFLAAFIGHVIIGLLIVKVGIQPVAETFGYELPTGATLVLVFWVQALSMGNIWGERSKE